MELGGPTSAEIIEQATRSTLDRAERAGLPVAGAGGLRHRRRRLPARRGGRADGRGGPRARAAIARAGGVRRPRRRGRAGVPRRRCERGAGPRRARLASRGRSRPREVAAAVADGLRGAGRDAVELPVADGGEGTMDVLLHRARGRAAHGRASATRWAAPSTPRSCCCPTARPRSWRPPRPAAWAWWPRRSATRSRPPREGTGELIVAACGGRRRDRAGDRGRLGHHRRRRRRRARRWTRPG